jgi:hypothetical protein
VDATLQNVIKAKGLHAREEDEGLQGVFKRLRRNGHQLEKGCSKEEGLHGVHKRLRRDKHPKTNTS